MGEMAETISMEMGAPLPLAQTAQAPAGLGYLMDARKQLDEFQFESDYGSGRRILKEPIGVIGMITPWNWPHEPSVREGGPRARCGLHHGAEAFGTRAAQRRAVRGNSR